MEIVQVAAGRQKEYLSLLLLADEQEDMIDKYLSRGDMFVLHDNGVCAECVVTREGANAYELKNIAVAPNCQKKGYGRALIDFIFTHYPDCQTLYVGTGDAPSTMTFYPKCGFVESHRVKGFFTKHYRHPIVEEGVQLVDMVYFKRSR